MIHYSWKKVSYAAQKDAKKIVDIIYYLTYNYRRNRFSGLYEQDFNGMSFLVSPEKLFKDEFKIQNIHIAQYVAFASLRSLGEYELSGQIALSLSRVPKRLHKIAKENPILTLTSDNFIHFYYE